MSLLLAWIGFAHAQGALVLEHEGWAVAAQTFTVTVTGAAPGDTVHLGASQVEGVSCPALLAGGCVDLGAPLQYLGNAVADASGAAVIDVPLPPRTAPYTRWYLQAANALGDVSDRGEIWTLPPAWGPAAVDGGVRNGDMELPFEGWSALSASWDLWDWYEGPTAYACPGGVWVSSPARGAQSLQLTRASDGVSCDGGVVGWPIHVTHTTLAWATNGEITPTIVSFDDRVTLSPAVAGPVVAADGWSEWAADLQPECGQLVYAEFRLTSGDEHELDDVRLDGRVCAIYADRDGDGTCPSGVDLDGDGFCVSAGEPDWPVHGADLTPIVMLEDFEDSPAPAPIVTADTIAPMPAFGTQAASVDPVSIEAWAFAPTVVTHETVVFQASMLGAGDWTPGTVHVALQLAVEQPALVEGEFDGIGPGFWVQHALDTSAICGETVGAVELSGNLDGWVSLMENPYPPYVASGDNVLVDELALAGEPCDIFVDGDSDGACAEGLDQDGDGLCVSAGEPTPGVIQDATP